MAPGSIIETAAIVTAVGGLTVAFIVTMADADEHVRAVRRRLRGVAEQPPCPWREVPAAANNAGERRKGAATGSHKGDSIARHHGKNS